MKRFVVFAAAALAANFAIAQDDADVVKNFTKSREKNPAKFEKANYSDGPVTGVPVLDEAAGRMHFETGGDTSAELAGFYERYLADHGRRNMQKRRQIGMVIQTGPHVPRAFDPDAAGDTPSEG